MLLLYILKSGMLHWEPYTATALLGFFNQVDGALKVFAETAVRSVVIRNCVIASFVRSGRTEDAVFWLRELVRRGDELSDGSLEYLTQEQFHTDSNSQ
jgi:pentatricopeptide repeat protein